MQVGQCISYCVTILLKLIIIAVYVFSIAYVHLRGKVRHKLGRQLSDHSTFLAPLNCFLYLFSKVLLIHPRPVWARRSSLFSP